MNPTNSTRTWPAPLTLGANPTRPCLQPWGSNPTQPVFCPWGSGSTRFNPIQPESKSFTIFQLFSIFFVVLAILPIFPHAWWSINVNVRPFKCFSIGKLLHWHCLLLKFYTKIRQLGRVSPIIVCCREISVTCSCFNSLVNMANLKPFFVILYPLYDINVFPKYSTVFVRV